LQNRFARASAKTTGRTLFCFEHFQKHFGQQKASPLFFKEALDRPVPKISREVRRYAPRNQCPEWGNCPDFLETIGFAGANRLSAAAPGL
jgi:hypothetical protein